MTFQYTTKHSSGEILTGRLWRNDNLNALPFYTDISRMDSISGPLLVALSGSNFEGSFGNLLMVSSLSTSCHGYTHRYDRNSQPD